MSVKLTGAACRAARALLDWSKRDLAAESAVALGTIQRIETGGDFYASTAERIALTFANFGVEITNGEGTGARRLPLVEATAVHGDDGVWKVSARWKHGNPLALFTVEAARAAAARARRRGDSEEADAFEAAARSAAVA